MDKKIKKAGKKLKVSEKDIKDIKKAKCCRIWCWLLKLGIAVIVFIAGYFIGKGTCPSVSSSNGGGGGLPPGYPYAFVPILAVGACKKRKSKIAILLASAIMFFIALKATPIFGQAIEYNVYKRRQKSLW